MSALDQAAAGFGGALVGLVVGANWPRMTAWLITRHARTTRAYNATHRHGAVTTHGTPYQPRTATNAGDGHTDTTGTTEGAEKPPDDDWNGDYIFHQGA